MENERLILFDPLSQFHKSVCGAVNADADFTLRLLIKKQVSPSSVSLSVFDYEGRVAIFTNPQQTEQGEYDCYAFTLRLKSGLYGYYFILDGVLYERFVGAKPDLTAGFFFDNVMPWQLSVVSPEYHVPLWLNRGVMYHVMVDRFRKCGNTQLSDGKVLRTWGETPLYRDADGTVKNCDFFGGNLKGIASKLAYLRSLSVTTLYLSPIFLSPSNHKYDTEDYEKIDPSFGTEEDFTSLCQKAEKYGIKVILDGVFNHVGSSSKYFNRGKKYGDSGAYNDENSPYRNWFYFREDGSYDCWWNFETLPRVNPESGAKQYFCGDDGIVARWLDKGASGWRLDVVDELSDPMLDAVVAAAKKAKSDAAIIGEVWEDASNKVSYGNRRRYFEGRQLDSVMNYPLKDAIIEYILTENAEALKIAAVNQINNYPKSVLDNLMNVLGTHDTARILSVLGDADFSEREATPLSDEQYSLAILRLRLAAALQYTFYGFPDVFYADEIATEGGADPFCRKCYGWGKENKELLSFYRLLGKLRKNNSTLRFGDFHVLKACGGTFAFSRTYEGKTIVVAVNAGRNSDDVALDGEYTEYFSSRKYGGSANLPPLSARIFIGDNAKTAF